MEDYVQQVAAIAPRILIVSNAGFVALGNKGRVDITWGEDEEASYRLFKKIAQECTGAEDINISIVPITTTSKVVVSGYKRFPWQKELSIKQYVNKMLKSGGFRIVSEE